MKVAPLPPDEAHHRQPDPNEVRERGDMPRLASDRTQKIVWIAFLVLLASLILLGLAWGMRTAPA